jgi:hypothetical protein
MSRSSEMNLMINFVMPPRSGALFILARSQASLCPTHFPVNSYPIKPPAVLT